MFYDFKAFVAYIVGLNNLLVEVFIGVALVVFLWGVFRYIYSAGDTHEKSNGREVMVWGIIALVVLICVWGIVVLVKNSLLGGASGARSTPSNNLPPVISI